MTDLINRVNNLEPEILNKLVEKYKELIPITDVKHQEEIPYLLYVINLAFNYINANYKHETSDWKSWGIVLIKRLFQKEKIITREDIYKHIDNFFEYKKSEYEKYVSNIALYSDEYYRDNPFINKYIGQLQ